MKVCVGCVLGVSTANTYVVVTADPVLVPAPMGIRLSNGVVIQLASWESNVSGTVAGRPEAFIELVRHPKLVGARWRINNSAVQPLNTLQYRGSDLCPACLMGAALSIKQNGARGGVW